MTYRVFARKYRPDKFSELVGQDHITRTLTKSLQNDRIAHAHVFSGPRGIGKTTTARLLAMAVNCENPEEGYEPCNECSACEQIKGGQDVDVIEIDGASNNSVDRIRELRENARYAPARHDRKVYIIDEVHMLSRSAFNALLKILEEPPDHVLFIFATTEIEQLPDTVLSRCQRYDFRLISTSEITDTLREICDKESIDATDEALYLIAKFAEGSLRDAQSILDQMISFAGAGDQELTEDLVSDTWGIAPFDQLIEFLQSFRDEDEAAVLELLSNHLDSGKDLMALISDLAEMVRNCLLLQQEDDSEFLSKDIPEGIIPELDELSQGFRRTELIWMFEQLLDLHQSLKNHSRFQRELAEIEFIRLTEGRPRYNLSEITDKLLDLEQGNHEANPDESFNTKTSKNISAKNSKTSDEVTSSETEQSSKTSSSSSEEEPNLENLTESDWTNFLEAIPNPARAFMRNCSNVTVEDELMVFEFDGRHANHVERLRDEKHQKNIRTALIDALGWDQNFELTVKNNQMDSDDENSNKNNDDSSTAGEEFLQKSREVLSGD